MGRQGHRPHLRGVPRGQLACMGRDHAMRSPTLSACSTSHHAACAVTGGRGRQAGQSSCSSCLRLHTGVGTDPCQEQQQQQAPQEHNSSQHSSSNSNTSHMNNSSSNSNSNRSRRSNSSSCHENMSSSVTAAAAGPALPNHLWLPPRVPYSALCFTLVLLPVERRRRMRMGSWSSQRTMTATRCWCTA